MPSKSKNVRESQKAVCQAAIHARRAALKEQGLDPAAIGKDPKLRALMARFRQIQKTLVAIQAKEKKNADLALRKQEKAEQAKLGKPEKKGKAKKKAEQKAEEAGKKAKKAKKEKKEEKED